MLTGWPRLGFTREIFPDAKLIHVMRDGRAVAQSFMETSWWEGWWGPQNWGWGELLPEYLREWESHERSFVALAAISWKVYMDNYEAARKLLPAGSILEVRYEDLCDDTGGILGEVLKYCELPPSVILDRAVEKIPVVSNNDKWRHVFSSRQQRILNDVLAEYLEKYNYR